MTKPMIPGGIRTICIIWRIFLRLDLLLLCTALAQHLITVGTGSDVNDIDYLDRDLSELCHLDRGISELCDVL